MTPEHLMYRSVLMQLTYRAKTRFQQNNDKSKYKLYEYSFEF